MSPSLTKRCVPALFTFFSSQVFSSQLEKYPAVTYVERRTQVPKPYLVIGGIALLAILHFINPLAAPVSNLFGFALPAFLSLKAIESPSPNDDVQWYTYWVLFGFINFIESFALRVLLYYIPWYFAFKTIFILWLQLPAFQGAKLMYSTLLKSVMANVHANRVAVPPSTNTHE
ncbi:hypothetical protein M378DRAFT_166067 [Amanita muscaria Koide BX008]|uniref:Protein YOP1 n=1 Tax=Amanita muscaria (strain Koide BX008) TaxID=946122 RepID=A0A0C2X0K4_AMAMK|nr:hypothetical protein M378DRAFT_166067 [Amanita muscaria Koide BX008]